MAAAGEQELRILNLEALVESHQIAVRKRLEAGGIDLNPEFSRDITRHLALALLQPVAVEDLGESDWDRTLNEGLASSIYVLCGVPEEIDSRVFKRWIQEPTEAVEFFQGAVEFASKTQGMASMGIGAQ